MFWQSLKLGLQFSPKFGHVTGYQKFHGTEGHTLKSGCGFTLRKV